uniref:Uncharacterized protein n=1 Tax=Globodera rostochiensis TaxID=31243 RepID=A0A914HAW2_GLORO
MSDNAEAVSVETVDGVRALRQENQILTEQNRSLTGEVSDQRVDIIQILTRIERLEAYAQNSQNGFRVQFSPLATQELHAMGRRMEQIDRNNTPAPARQASSTLTNSVGRAQNSAPIGRAAAATTRKLLIGTNQAMAREAVQPALNASNARSGQFFAALPICLPSLRLDFRERRAERKKRIEEGEERKRMKGERRAERKRIEEEEERKRLKGERRAERKRIEEEEERKRLKGERRAERKRTEKEEERKRLKGERRSERKKRIEEEEEEPIEGDEEIEEEEEEQTREKESKAKKKRIAEWVEAASKGETDNTG